MTQSKLHVIKWRYKISISSLLWRNPDCVSGKCLCVLLWKSSRRIWGVSEIDRLTPGVIKHYYLPSGLPRLGPIDLGPGTSCKIPSVPISEALLLQNQSSKFP